jgi:hypothetical protein
MDPARVEKNLGVIADHGHQGQVVGRIVPRGDGAAVRYRGSLRL